MFKLKIIQANFGDSFLVEFGSDDDKKYFLVDGGPKHTYSNHLRYVLQYVSQDNGRLESIVISHVDEDHITGILDLFVELESQNANDSPQLVNVNRL